MPKTSARHRDEEEGLLEEEMTEAAVEGFIEYIGALFD